MQPNTIRSNSNRTGDKSRAQHRLQSGLMPARNESFPTVVKGGRTYGTMKRRRRLILSPSDDEAEEYMENKAVPIKQVQEKPSSQKSRITRVESKSSLHGDTVNGTHKRKAESVSKPTGRDLKVRTVSKLNGHDTEVRSISKPTGKDLKVRIVCRPTGVDRKVVSKPNREDQKVRTLPKPTGEYRKRKVQSVSRPIEKDQKVRRRRLILHPSDEEYEEEKPIEKDQKVRRRRLILHPSDEEYEEENEDLINELREEEEAKKRIEEAKEKAKQLTEVAIKKRTRAQEIMQQADLAMYRSQMALNIALAKSYLRNTNLDPLDHEAFLPLI